MLRVISILCGIICITMLFALTLVVFQITSDGSTFMEVLSTKRSSSVLASVLFLFPLLCLILISSISGAGKKLIAPTVVLVLSQLLMSILARFPVIADVSELIRQAIKENDLRVLTFFSGRFLISVSILILYVISLLVIALRLNLNGQFHAILIMIRFIIILIVASLASIVASFLSLYLWMALYGIVGIFLLKWKPTSVPGVRRRSSRMISIRDDIDR